jgi:hypothetical protein
VEFAFGSSAPLIAISTAEASDSSSSSAVSSVMLRAVRSSDLCGVTGVALSPAPLDAAAVAFICSSTRQNSWMAPRASAVR